MLAGAAVAVLTSRQSVINDPAHEMTVARAQAPAETWTQRAPLPLGREAMAGAFIDGRFYVTHGNAGIWGDVADQTVFDPELDPPMGRWSARRSALVPRAELVGVAVNGKLYAIGGRSTSGFCPLNVCDAVEIYDPVTNEWTMGTPMPTARAGLGAAAVGTKIYVVGGRTRNSPYIGQPLPTLEIYDTVTGSWTTGPPMPTPRMDVYSTVALDGKVYVIGGFNPNSLGPNQPGGDLDIVEVFDPETGRWSTAPPIQKRRSHAMAAVCDGRMYVVGGQSGFVNIGDVERFDPRIGEVGAWETVMSLPLPASEMAAAGTSNGNIILAAGAGPYSNSADQVFALECGPPQQPGQVNQLRRLKALAHDRTFDRIGPRRSTFAPY
jgi:N-acetylneuraminic acid mutarotase